MNQLKAIESKIFELRGQKVMLDRDLAQMYGVETRILNQAVKRNISRFPEDFMVQLNEEEWRNLKSQIVISSFHIPLTSVEIGIFLEILKCYALLPDLILSFLLDTASLNHCLS